MSTRASFVKNNPGRPEANMSGKQLTSSNMSFAYTEVQCLCDAAFKVQDVKFPVHRIILSKCSTYFRTLFLQGLSQNQRVYDLTDISPATMELILVFAYTGSCPVTEGNVRDVMIAAYQYNITEIVQICSNFLLERMCPENCMSIWQLTRTCHSPEGHLKASRYILEHFEEAASSEEWLQLSVQDLADILGRDELNVRTEDVAFEGMMRWIVHMPEQRKVHLLTLMTKIRLSLMREKFFKSNVMSNQLVQENSQCRDMVTHACLVSDHLGPSTSFRNPVCRPRLPRAILFAIGGWGRSDATNTIETYDVRLDRWVSVSPGGEGPRRSCHGTAFLDGCVYVIGGLDQLEHFDSVHRLNLVTCVWQEVSPMNWQRCGVSVTVLDGLIYALGGFDSNGHLRVAERFQPQKNQWSNIAPMQEQRSSAGCTSLHGKVYICGGHNGVTNLHTAEFYNPQTNQWTMIQHMSSRRSGLGVVAYRDVIFAVGGFDGDNPLTRADVYDPRTNSWTDLPPMNTIHSHFGIGVIDDRVFVAGGIDGLSDTNFVEFYDATLNEWRVASRMGTARSDLSCCVVSGLPNMHEYVFSRDHLPLLEFEVAEENGGAGN